MSTQWYTPDIAGMIRKRQMEGATTSANVGTFAKPLGAPLVRTQAVSTVAPVGGKSAKRKGKAETAEDEGSQLLTWEDYLHFGL